jgi:acetyl-CoA carboxylase biotin carboxyl carrier protein
MSEDDKTQAPDDELIRSLWQEARGLIKQLEGSTVQRLAVQAGEYKIEIERGAATAAPVMGTVTTGGTTGQLQEVGAQPPPEADNRHPIVAPLVGTFYRSANPGAKPFVEEGDVVDQGQTLCIVEAMKIMNQVSADRPGRIAEVLVKDGDWVEFQQVLMYMEPTGS